MTVTILPAGSETVSAYHASGAWGSTLISHFRRNPRLAHLLRTGAHRLEPTASMRFGTAFHTLMDPGGGFATAYRIGPDVDHRSKAWKDAVAAAAADGVQLLGHDEHADLVAMQASVRDNPVAAHLCDGAEHEVGIRMTSTYGGAVLQCRTDLLHRWRLIADLKTCADVDDFAASVLSYGYHRQAALYRYLVHAACGEMLPFSFIVVERAAPLYRCRVIDLDEDYLALGWAEVEEALIQIGERMRTGDWSDHRDAEVLSLPTWKRAVALSAEAA